MHVEWYWQLTWFEQGCAPESLLLYGHDQNQNKSQSRGPKTLKMAVSRLFFEWQQLTCSAFSKVDVTVFSICTFIVLVLLIWRVLTVALRHFCHDTNLCQYELYLASRSDKRLKIYLDCSCSFCSIVSEFFPLTVSGMLFVAVLLVWWAYKSYLNDRTAYGQTWLWISAALFRTT